MSGETDPSWQDSVFHQKHKTEFMRVTQIDDPEGKVRHPGSPDPVVLRNSKHSANKPTFNPYSVRSSMLVEPHQHGGGVSSAAPSRSKEKTFPTCPTHGVRQSFWCRTCEEVACGECLFDKHPTDGHHKLAKLQDVAAEIRGDAMATIVTCHGDATKVFSYYLKHFVTMLESLHHAGLLMQKSRKLIKATERADDFTSVTSVYEEIKKINSEIVQVKLECEDEDLEGDDPQQKTEEAEDASVIKTDVDEAVEAKDTSELKTDVDKVKEAKDSSETKTEVDEAKEAKEDVPKIVEPKGKFSLLPQIAEKKSQATNSTVFAIHTDGRLAKLHTEDRGLHIYSLSRFPSSEYSVAVRLGLLMQFIERENPVVFLDFNVGCQKIGRLYIELRADMRRSLQFLHLCLGTLGPSYKGSRVDGISEKGDPGEYLRMGDYTGQSGQGGIGVIDGLEWGDKWTDSKKAGQLCGVGGDCGEKRFGALFALCIRDNPKDVFRCPFGKVTKGMDVLQKLARTEPIEAAFISDCGALIPIE